MSTSGYFLTHEDVQVLAGQMDLDIAAEYFRGIVENMLILRKYSELVCSFPLSDHCAPAFGYMP